MNAAPFLLTMLFALAGTDAPIEADGREAANKKAMAAVVTVLGSMSHSVEPAQRLRSLYSPMINSEPEIRAALAHAKVLGEAKKCDDFEVAPVEQIPGAMRFKGDCTFANGKAQVLIAFGIPEKREGVVLFALQLRHVEATAPAAVPADTAAPAPTAPAGAKPDEDTPPAAAPAPADEG